MAQRTNELFILYTRSLKKGQRTLPMVAFTNIVHLIRRQAS